MDKREQLLDICTKCDLDEVWVNFENPFDRGLDELYNEGDRVIFTKDIGICFDKSINVAFNELQDLFASPSDWDKWDEYNDKLNLCVNPFYLRESGVKEEYDRIIGDFTCLYRKGVGLLG